MAAEQLRYRPTVRTTTPWALGVLLVAAALALQTQLYTGQARTVSAIFMYVALACRGTSSAATPATPPSGRWSSSASVATSPPWR